MKLNENKEGSRKHVIEKIKRISAAMDRREFWVMILMVSLFGAIVSGLAYYFFFH